MTTVRDYLKTVAHPKHYLGKIECIDCILKKNNKRDKYHKFY